MKTKILLAALLAALSPGVPCLADTADGSCLEEFTLLNFQPQSPTYRTSVPSTSYSSKATVFLLLASW